MPHPPCTGGSVSRFTPAALTNFVYEPSEMKQGCGKEKRWASEASVPPFRGAADVVKDVTPGPAARIMKGTVMNLSGLSRANLCGGPIPPHNSILLRHTTEKRRREHCQADGLRGASTRASHRRERLRCEHGPSRPATPGLNSCQLAVAIQFPRRLAGAEALGLGGLSLFSRSVPGFDLKGQP